MFVLRWVSFLLMALMLMMMLAKARPWMKVQIPGKVIKTIPMGLWARIQIHRSNLLALLFAVVFGNLTGWLSNSLAYIVGSFSLLMVLLPMRYTFTSQGIAIGEAIFRAWDEFTGIRTLPGRVELQHSQWIGRLTLFVDPSELENMTKKISRKISKTL